MHELARVPPKFVAQNNQSVVTYRRYTSDSDKSAFVQELAQVNWTKLYGLDLCIEHIQFFYDTIISSLDKHLPVVKNVKRLTDKPWVTDKYRDLIKKRQYAFKTGNKYLFRYTRNKVNKMGKQLRKHYYDKLWVWQRLTRGNGGNVLRNS